MAALNALPADVLNHILSGVNKVEHIKMLLDKFTEEEVASLREINKHIFKRVNDFTAERFSKIKSLFTEVKKFNKKSNNSRKGITKKLLVELKVVNPAGEDKLMLITVDKVCVSRIHGRNKHGYEWDFQADDDVKKYYVEEIQEAVPMEIN